MGRMMVGAAGTRRRRPAIRRFCLPKNIAKVGEQLAMFSLWTREGGLVRGNLARIGEERTGPRRLHGDRDRCSGRISSAQVEGHFADPFHVIVAEPQISAIVVPVRQTVAATEGRGVKNFIVEQGGLVFFQEHNEVGGIRNFGCFDGIDPRQRNVLFRKIIAEAAEAVHHCIDRITPITRAAGLCKDCGCIAVYLHQKRLIGVRGVGAGQRVVRAEISLGNRNLRWREIGIDSWANGLRGDLAAHEWPQCAIFQSPILWVGNVPCPLNRALVRYIVGIALLGMMRPLMGKVFSNSAK